MINDLEVAIFSYNRGDYLKNCVESVVKGLPGVKITIFDDHSDDLATVKYLKQLGNQVILGKEDNDTRHGNLYSNMQMALDLSSKRFLLLLQDDLQVVRTVHAQDMKTINTIFNDPDIAFLRPQFMKFSDGTRNIELLTPSEKLRAYFPKDEFTKGIFGHAYCDIAICDVPKLKKIGWTFLDTERKNQIQAHSLFKYTPFMADSFLFYCPEVPCYRNKKLFLASKLVQNKLKGKISTFTLFSQEKNHHFINRNVDIWPIAEDFLETNNTDIIKPFVYQDYNKSIFLKILYKIERGLYQVIKLIRI